MNVVRGATGADQSSAKLIEDAADVREQSVMEFLFDRGVAILCAENSVISEACVGVCHDSVSIKERTSCIAPSGASPACVLILPAVDTAGYKPVAAPAAAIACGGASRGGPAPAGAKGA